MFGAISCDSLTGDMRQFDHFGPEHRKCFDKFREIGHGFQSAQRFWDLKSNRMKKSRINCKKRVNQ